MSIAERALDMIADGAVVGLGSGRAATAFVNALGQRVRAGLHVRGIPTSTATAILAQRLGIPLTTLEEIDTIDITVDGADEVDPQLNLIKGLGGALVREKIVAATSKRLVILVGAEKLVPALGAHGVLPVEIVPFGLPLCRKRLTALGRAPQLRMANGQIYVTDNHNYILDCQLQTIDVPVELEQSLLAIPGVVGTGLFLDMADTVLVQDGETMRVLERPNSSTANQGA